MSEHDPSFGNQQRTFSVLAIAVNTQVRQCDFGEI